MDFAWLWACTTLSHKWQTIFRKQYNTTFKTTRWHFMWRHNLTKHISQNTTIFYKVQQHCRWQYFTKPNISQNTALDKTKWQLTKHILAYSACRIGEMGTEPPTFWFVDDAPYLLRHSPTSIIHFTKHSGISLYTTFQNTAVAKWLWWQFKTIFCFFSLLKFETEF